MKKSTETLLDSLAEKFDKRGDGVDHARFIELRGSGLPLADAVRGAGSTMKSRKGLQVYGSKLLKENPEYQLAVLDILREKQRMLLDAMTQEKMNDASLSSQAVALGIVTDKINLEEGRPTARVENLSLDSIEGDKQRLLGFILGRLSAGKSLK